MINCAKKLRCFTCSLIAEQKFPCTKHVLPSKQRKSVALLIETSKAYSRVLLEGIVEYQRERDSWSIFLPEQERGAAPWNCLSTWEGDGILARIETSAIARSVSKLGLPVVDPALRYCKTIVILSRSETPVQASKNLITSPKKPIHERTY